MYQGLVSMILIDNEICQGENVSPILFSLYLNDLEDYLVSYGFKGVFTTIDKQDHPIDIENSTRVPVGDDLSYNEWFLKHPPKKKKFKRKTLFICC